MKVSLFLFHYHLAGGAVEYQFEAAAVVKEIERTGCLCPLVDRAHAQLVADAVSGTHEFRAFSMGKLVCRLDIRAAMNFVKFAGEPLEL